MSSAPHIGITCDFETIIDRRGRAVPRFVLSAAYAQAVQRAGGQPWLMPHTAAETTPSYSQLDGVVISGGDFDIPPNFYGAAVRPGCGRTLEPRSRFERDLCAWALDEKVPLLGICGGMQMLCVVLGGTLFQDVAERPHTNLHQQPHDTTQPFHTVQLREGSLAARCYRRCDIAVNTTHHQLVDNLGPRGLASGHAPDGVVEAIEVLDHPFALGLQWHPEVLVAGTPAHMEHLGPYIGLVEAARHRAAQRG
jgi:putative glutamine amidotransferase